MRLRTVGELVLDHRAEETLHVAASSPVSSAAKLMADHEIQAVLVMDGAELPVGIFSSRELIERVVLPGRDMAKTPLSLVTNRNVLRIPEATTLDVALALMNMYRCSHLIVGEGPCASGLVSMRDVATQLLRAEKWAEEARLDAAAARSAKQSGGVAADLAVH